LKDKIRRHGLKLGVLVLSLLTLVLVAAVPGWAQSSSTSTASPSAPAVHTLEGKVTAVAQDKSSFTIQNGNQSPVTVLVDSHTLYFVVPAGRAAGDIRNPVQGDSNVPPGLKDRVQGDNRGNSPAKPSITTPTVTPALKPAQIPPNWKNDLSFLNLFNRQAAFSDIQVGDSVIARARVSDNLAQQVLIIKAPVIQNIKGTISGLVGNSITITPISGAPVTLTWDINTHFDLKGLIIVQQGQNVVATYNHNTLVAQIVNVLLPVPSPTATLSPGVTTH
jgi:hypothetical protein